MATVTWFDKDGDKGRLITRPTLHVEYDVPRGTVALIVASDDQTGQAVCLSRKQAKAVRKALKAALEA